MQQISDQIDKFHEDVCYWHLFDDIINGDSAAGADTVPGAINFQQKTNFYSPEEYLQYQKSLLKKELKNQISKHALAMVDQYRADDNAQYSLTNRQRVKKFFALSFKHLVTGVAEGQKVFQKGQRLPLIRDSDLVVAFPSDSTDIKNEHMLCVVDSIQEEEKQLILKIVLRDQKNLDERNYNLMNLIAQDSNWTLLKVCSLENFNRGYVGYDQFQICNLHNQLLDLSLHVNKGEANFPVSYESSTFPDPGFALNRSQQQALSQCFQADGIVAIEGGYATGKTSLIPLIAWGLLQAEGAIKEEKKRQLQSDVARTYTIAEMLANADDSDDEMYDTTTEARQTSQTQFPWYQKEYRTVFDMNEGILEDKTQGYPESQQTDKHINLKPKHVLGLSDPPQRIIIVCAANSSVDLVLDKLACLADKVPIVRLGHSMTREDLNQKYALEPTKKNDVEAYTRVQQRMENAKILIAGSFSLRQHALEKSPLLFDTVIFDDASLMNETDCLSALSHGANRAIFLGNRAMSQNMFLLNPSSINKTLFYRIKECIQLEPIDAKAKTTTAKTASPTKSSQKKRGKAVAKPAPAASAAATASVEKPQITFVDSTVSQQQMKKESFENFEEANQVADYILAFKNQLDVDNMAIMTPFRTQALVIKNVIQEQRKGDMGRKLCTFSTVGSFEDFVSRRFSSIIVSMVRTESFTEKGGPLLNSQDLIDFLMSRVTDNANIVIISKAGVLNDIWKDAFLTAPNATLMEI